VFEHAHDKYDPLCLYHFLALVFVVVAPVAVAVAVVVVVVVDDVAVVVENIRWRDGLDCSRKNPRYCPCPSR